MAQHLQMLQRVSYDDLYRRWEKGNWSATEIDLSEDRRQWTEAFSDLERRAGTLRCRYEDWVDITAGRTDPRLALLRGRLLPKGNPIALWRMQKLFGR